MNISFSESISSNLNGYGVDIRSINRDYFAYGEHLSNGLPFSNKIFHGNLMKLESAPLIYSKYHLLLVRMMIIFDFLEYQEILLL